MGCGRYEAALGISCSRDILPSLHGSVDFSRLLLLSHTHISIYTDRVPDDHDCCCGTINVESFTMAKVCWIRSQPGDVLYINPAMYMQLERLENYASSYTIVMCTSYWPREASLFSPGQHS